MKFRIFDQMPRSRFWNPQKKKKQKKEFLKEWQKMSCKKIDDLEEIQKIMKRHD